MSACGSLQHIFENPLPENPTLLESLSWSQTKPLKPIDHSSSFTEIFGELHFKEKLETSASCSCSSSSSSFTEIDHAKLSQNEVSDINQTPYLGYVSSTPIKNHTNSHKNSDSFSPLSSESLQFCTEGLGFESSDDVEDLKAGVNECWQNQREKEDVKKQLTSEDFSYGECRTKSRVIEYPPPISCIGESGKPWVSFRAYRKNGRFVLREIRIPSQELLHAHREGGRLKLHFVEPDEEFLEAEEEEEYDDVESIEERELNIGDENDKCVTDQVNEEKEIDA